LSFGGANLWCGNPTLQQYRHLASDSFGLQIGAEVTAPAQLSRDPFIACKTSRRGSYYGSSFSEVLGLTLQSIKIALLAVGYFISLLGDVERLQF